jgi:RNase P subunit RPR2
MSRVSPRPNDKTLLVDRAYESDEDAIREAVAILLAERGSEREAGVAERHRTHSFCDECYAGLVDIGAANVDPRRAPLPGIEEACCSCGGRHRSGIYLTLDRDFGNCTLNAGIGLP